MSKIKVAVIMGGISSEHDVSIMSGKEIIKNLDKTKYIVKPILIDKRGRGIEKIIKIKPDVAMIALHGKGGEDGCIQGFLESVGVPYTGSGITASAIGMDKIIFRELMKIEKISIPNYVVIEKTTKNIVPTFEPPYFVKPFNGGSSVGVSFVKDRKGLTKAVNLAFKYSDKVIIDKNVKGLEVNCGVVGNKNPKALPVIEIHPLAGRFFDYKSKYAKGGSEEIVPARIDDKIAKKIQDISLKVYKAVGCRGYARVDFILENDAYPVVLEINTLPGMTSTSLLPKEAKAVGITYSRLLDMIITYALKEN